MRISALRKKISGFVRSVLAQYIYTRLRDSFAISAVQPNTEENARILVNDLATAAPNGLSELCFPELGASGSEYKVLIKSGK